MKILRTISLQRPTEHPVQHAVPPAVLRPRHLQIPLDAVDAITRARSLSCRPSAYSRGRCVRAGHAADTRSQARGRGG